MKPFLAATLLLSTAALAQDGGTASPDAGTGAPARKAPLDVEHMPFTPDSIRQVMGHHVDEIQGCYEEWLAGKGNRTPEGKLVTSFTISPAGLVKGAKVLNKGTAWPLREPALKECVVGVLTALTFPKPADGREHPIEYPFNLKAIK
jgi:hypothetical protein